MSKKVIDIDSEREKRGEEIDLAYSVNIYVQKNGEVQGEVITSVFENTLANNCMVAEHLWKLSLVTSIMVQEEQPGFPEASIGLVNFLPNGRYKGGLVGIKGAEPPELDYKYDKETGEVTLRIIPVEPKDA